MQRNRHLKPCIQNAIWSFHFLTLGFLQQMVAELESLCRSAKDSRGNNMNGVVVGGSRQTHTWTLGKFLFGIHFPKGVILTSANTANSSRLTSSSPGCWETNRDKKRRAGTERMGNLIKQIQRQLHALQKYLVWQIQFSCHCIYTRLQSRNKCNMWSYAVLQQLTD